MHLKLAAGTGNPIKSQDYWIVTSNSSPSPPPRAFQGNRIWCLSCYNGKQVHIISFNVCFGAGWSAFWHYLTRQTGSCEGISHKSHNQLRSSRHNVSVSGGMGRNRLALAFISNLRCSCLIAAAAFVRDCKSAPSSTSAVPTWFLFSYGLVGNLHWSLPMLSFAALPVLLAVMTLKALVPK